MAFIPFPDCAELVATYTLPGGNVAKNVYGIRDVSILTWEPPLLTSLINYFTAWETSTGRVQRSNQVTLTNVTARNLSEPDSFVVEQATTIAGLANSPVLPANVTFCVKSVTGLAGRTHRGRTFWVGLTEGSVVGDFVQSTNANAIVAALNTLRTTLGSQGFAMVVLSRTLNGVPRTTGQATDITSWQAIDFRVDTQRRRLIGEGQ